MSTVFSPPFRFVEWHSYVVNGDDPTKWVPDLDPSGKNVITSAYRDIENKWVYLFRDYCGEITWEGEYLVKNGFINPVSLEGNREKERDKRPEPQLGNDWMRLPHTINGARAYYYGYVSRMRLPIDAVRQLTNRCHELLPYMDLDETEEYGASDPSPHRILYSGAAWVFPCVEPVSIALNLAQYYQTAANDLIMFTSEYEGQSDTQRKRVRDRNKTKMLAEMLVAVLDSDPEDKQDFRDDFATGGEKKMRDFLKDYDAQVKAKTREADRRGAAVCHWLRSEVMGIAEVAHFIFEDVDAPAYLNAWAMCVNRLQECTPGKAYLAYLIESNGHFVHKYVLRTEPAPDNIFQVGRKCASAIVALWTELAGLHIRLRGKDTARALQLSLEYISRIEMIVVQVTPKTVMVATIEQKMVKVKIELVTIKVTPQAPAKAAEWIQDGHAVADFIGRLTLCVEVVNLGLSIKALITAEPGIANTVWAAMGALGSSLDLLSVAGAMIEMSKKSLAVIGGISAVIDAVCAFKDAAGAASRNDYSAMIGYGLGMGLGSALIAAGAYAAFAGAGAASTGVGAPPGAILAVVGGILVAAGWVVTTFTSESVMELFIAHCLWGEDYGSGSDNPDWAGGTFASWQGNLDKQLSALYNILAAFRLKATDYAEVKIFMGLVNATSKFYIDFEGQYNHERMFRPQLCYSVGEQTITQVGGDRADLHCFSTGESEGQKYVRIEMVLPADRQVPMLQWRYARCAVHLDLNGDGSQYVPSSGDKVPYHIKSLGGILADEKSSLS